MKKNISEIQGAQFPESVEINQWVAELNGDYAYFVGRITVLNEKQCMVVTQKKYDVDHDEDEDEVEDDFVENLMLDGKELLIADTLEDIKIDIESEEALRNIERKKQAKKVIGAFKAIREYYADSESETDNMVRKELKALEDVSEIRFNCFSLLPNPEKDYSCMFTELRNVVRRGFICFFDNDYHDISTRIPLSAIENVRINMLHKDKDAVEVRTASNVYYIYKKNNDILYHVLTELYSQY